MPQAFVAIGEYVVYLAATWGASTATAVAIGSFVTTALTYGTYYFLLNKASGLLLDKGSGRRVNSGLEVAITDTAAEGLAIYGCVRCNGINKIPPITGGQDGKYLEQVIELCMHDVRYIPAFWADDVIVSDTQIQVFGGTVNDGRVLEGKYINKMYVRRYYSATQFSPSPRSVDFILNDRYPTVFTSDFVGNGRTYAAISYEWDEKVYSGGVPNMAFVVNGKECYDPRKDSTQSGGSGAHRVNDPTTWEFTSNPALHWADYSMEDFGGNVSDSKINWPSVMAAANICDAQVEIPGLFTTFVDEANATHSGNDFYKTGAGNSWGDGSYSTDGYSKCSISATSYSSAGAVVFGLHTAASLTSGGEALSTAYAWYLHGDTGVSKVLEGGLNVYNDDSPAAGDIYKIDYDGSHIYWWHNGRLVHVKAVATPNQLLYFNTGTYHVGQGVTINVAPRYTSNVRIGLARDWRDNAKIFIDAMVGRMIRRDGVWFIYAGAYDAPTFSVGKADWLQIESIKTVAPRDSGRWNTVRCWFTDKDRNWQREECFPRRNATYRADDNNEEIPLELEQPACTDEYEAQRKAEFLLRQSRNQIALVGVLPPRFHHIATGEMGTFTFDDFGWSSKIMRVRAMDMLGEGQVRIAIAEEQEADWEDLDPSEYNAPSTSLIPTTNPTTPSAPTSLTINANFNGTLYIEIGQPLIFPDNAYYQLVRSTVSTNAGAGVVVYEGLMNKAYVVQPASLHWYFARVIVNSYSGAWFPTTPGIGVSGLPLGWTTNQINSNAATDLFSAYNSSVASNNLFAGQLVNVNWTAPGIPCTALLTATGKLRRTIGGGASFFTIRLEQNPILGETYDTFMATSDTVFVMQKEFAINSSLAVQSAGVTFNASSHGVATYSDWRLKVEVIKR